MWLRIFNLMKLWLKKWDAVVSWILGPNWPAQISLTLHVPLDDSTRHIISTAELAAMNKGNVVINCARGGVVDNDALIDALDSGHIRAAGVDVMPVEPPEPNHPLILRKDVVMTPHNGAGAVLLRIAMSEMAAQNALMLLKAL